MKHNFWRGVICGLVLAFVGKAAMADTTITIIGPSEIEVERDGVGVYSGFAIWQADFTTACHASPPDKQLQVGFPAGGANYSGWVNAGCDYGPGFDAVHLIAADGTHWPDSGEGYVATTTWDGTGDGVGSRWIISISPSFRNPAGDWNGDGRVSIDDIFAFLADYFTGQTTLTVYEFLDLYFGTGTPPPLTICPCTMDDYPFSIHPQGMADDECYEHYKRRSCQRGRSSCSVPRIAACRTRSATTARACSTAT